MTAMAAIIMAGLIVLVLIIKPRKSPVDLSEIQQQLTLLGEQQEALTAEFQSLREAQEFQAQLLSPPKEDMTER
ncbi:MAG: hypothetical protein KAJ13_09195 [Gemmatimonadetes bacterium]|jgi:hypothetical protein|nr:hypothetical protein [Gemmatimonadota bacterium]